MPELDLLLDAVAIQSLVRDPLDAARAATVAATATGAVRDYCGWRVAPPVEEEMTRTADGPRRVFLPTLHVTDVHTVTDAGRPLTIDVDVDWDDHGVLERLRGRWARKRRGVTATITHGHAECPGAIAQAIADAVARGTLVPSGGIVSESTLSASVRWGRIGAAAARAIFLPHELEVLDRYRIPQSR